MHLPYIRSLEVGSPELVQPLYDATGGPNLFISLLHHPQLIGLPPILFIHSTVAAAPAGLSCSRQGEDGKGSHRIECLQQEKKKLPRNS